MDLIENLDIKSFVNNNINHEIFECSLCEIEITKLSTITVSSKTYKDICCFCEEKIKENRYQKLLRLKKTIYNRKNLDKILINTGIPLHHFEKHKDNKIFITIKNSLKKNNTVFLYGNKQGSGKTTSAIISMRYFIRKGFSPIFVRSVDLFDELRSAHTNQAKIDITEVLKKYFDTDLFILDDLGTEKGSEFVETRVYSILDHRVFYNKKTIITSNFDPQKIEKMYGSNLMSRACSGNVIQIIGTDLRINK